jgi:hypothetical protein
MSIVNKHPAPWRLTPNGTSIVDGTCKIGDECFDEGHIVTVTSSEDLRFSNGDVKRLILAAPELLAALKAVLGGEPGARTPAHALIARIEGK